MFPRVHQWEAVRTLETAAKVEGPGHDYLVEHSAGSGKSNTIAWLVWHTARMQWRPSAGKSRDRKIETTPKEMHRAAFADEPARRLRENPRDLRENAAIRKEWLEV